MTVTVQLTKRETVLYNSRWYVCGCFGAVAEWFKATVLKTVVPKGIGGSNPSCSDRQAYLVRGILTPVMRQQHYGGLTRSVAESPMLFRTPAVLFPHVWGPMSFRKQSLSYTWVSPPGTSHHTTCSLSCCQGQQRYQYHSCCESVDQSPA